MSENAIMRWKRHWQESTPMVTKGIIYTLSSIGVIAALADVSLPTVWGNVTQWTIFEGQYFRFFTSIWAMTGPLDWLFTCMMLSSFGSAAEREVGSVLYLWMMTLLGCTTNVLYTLFTLSLALNPVYPLPQFLYYPCTGFWTVAYGLCTRECLKHPDMVRMMWPLPFAFKSKYFPWATAIIFSLFLGFQMSFFVAIIAGYLLFYNAFNCIRPNVLRIQRWENGCLRIITTLPGFVSNASCSGFEMLLPTRTVSRTNYASIPQAVPVSSSSRGYQQTAPTASSAFVMAPAVEAPRSFAVVEEKPQFSGKGHVSGTAGGGVAAHPATPSTQRQVLAKAAEDRAGLAANQGSSS